MRLNGIIISEDHYNALGVVRSLGEAGIDVYLILTTNSERTFVDKSKYVLNTTKVGHDDERIIGTIFEITKNYNANDSIFFLFPLSDYSSELIDRNRNRFDSNTVVPNMHGEMAVLQNKENAKLLAKANGISVPRSQVIDLQQDNILEWSVFPAIIKPVLSIEGAKSHISIVEARNDLLDKLKWFKEMNYSRVMLEEYIHGEDEFMIEVLGYSTNETVFVPGVIKKIREYPMRRGSTSYAEFVETIPGLQLDNIIKYVYALHYTGLFDIELKYANGLFYFIESNFRNGAPSYALTCMGYNIPEMWIHECLNHPICCKETHVTSQTFMCEQTDFLNVLKREVGLVTWINERKTAKCIFSVREDMKPVKAYYSIFAKDVLTRLWRKFKRA